MLSFRTFATSVVCAALFSILGNAQDMSKYRDFQFGMNIESVANLAHMNASSAKTAHQRPELIQTLDWELYGYFDSSPKSDSVRDIRFDFYNGELFKMLVTYDTVQTKGLTADDLVEALSARYGPADKPQTSIVIPGYPTYNDNEQVLARWENDQYSYNLFRSSYGAAFGLVAFSKRLELLASAASREAERLDRLEAPARETERLKKQEQDDKALQEKARLISKPNFRP